jgi:bis(5'-nucleosyl)-tetraphosphatase (symmetrical)
MATYVIGDVQGCYAELMMLLEKIKFDQSKDQLRFVGDLVSRGPQSLEVLRFIKKLKSKKVIVLGNHDLHLLAVAFGGRKTNPDDLLQDVLDSSDRDELLHWLRKQKLCHYDKKFNFLMAHAGISPQWDLVTAQRCAKEVEEILQGNQYVELFSHMYGDKPDVWSEDLQGWDRCRYIINAFTRIRYCDKNYHLNLSEKGPVGTQPDNLIPWFKTPNRGCADINIVFGHWASLMGQTNEPHVFVVDTGCCWGKSLTALRLEDLALFHVAAIPQ